MQSAPRTRLVPSRRKLVVGFALLIAAALAFGASAADAALTRNLRVTGTSTAPGTCSITIESFGLDPELLSGGATTASPFIVDVPIPTSSSAANSASLIRNDVDAALPSDYTVTIHPSISSVVTITRSTGTFTLSISEDVAGQRYEEAAEVYVPALGPLGALALSALLLLTAAWLVRRGRREHPAV